MLFATCFVVGAGTAYADNPDYTIKDPSYFAKYVGQSEADPIVMEAGSSKTVTVRFQNVGGAHWENGRSRYISAYTVDKRYRESAFAGENWRSKFQSAKMKGERIAPGKIGELEINLVAREEPGVYREEFHLAAENHTWMNKGYFYLDIKVVEKKVEASKEEDKSGEVPDEEEKEEELSEHKAQVVFLSKRKFSLRGGEAADLLVTYRNSGELDLVNPQIMANRPVPPLGVEGALSFAQQSWQSHEKVGFIGQTLASGAFTQTSIPFRAPKAKGTYTMELLLMQDGKEVQSSRIQIEVEVTTDALPSYRQPVFQEVETVRLEKEPTIRVGVWKIEDKAPAEFRSENEDYHIYDGELYRGTLPRQSLAKMSVVGDFIAYNDGAVSFFTNQYVRMVPAQDKRAVFQILNHDRSVKWRGPNDFDQYRGVMEYRFTQARDVIYIINELGMEDYVAGIAESSNGAPIEYQKALMTAARTYAYYIMTQTDKHDKRNFDVVAHTGDQLYLGYVSEQGAYNNVLATRATRGQMITYNGDIVVTPYFGNSDGKTRSWNQVWGGDKPWLVPVEAVFDRRDGKRLFGHGVGMSQRDAAYRADDLYETWEQLIHYYYTGVDITKMYH